METRHRVHWRFLEEGNTGNAKSLLLKDTIAIWHQDGVWYCDIVGNPAISGQRSFWHAGKKDPRYSPLFLWQTYIAHGSSDELVKTWSAVLIREYIMCMLTWRMITHCSSHKTDPQATKSTSAYLVFVTCSFLLEIVTLPWWSLQLNTEQASWFAAHNTRFIHT